MVVVHLNCLFTQVLDMGVKEVIEDHKSHVMVPSVFCFILLFLGKLQGIKTWIFLSTSICWRKKVLFFGT